MSKHWKMNRIGFVNFWLYDEDEFVFENGRLLLRGQNGSGKSITTQSFIPFILDGDRTPSRLDPFGSSDRKMEYYFLGDGEREDSTGYLYLEFWKEDTKEYRTIGIGQRARKGKQTTFWGFVLLDGRRIGRDLFLYREVGSSKIPLDKIELKKLLGNETPFTDVPGEYKELVNKYLFGFGRAEQYEQFIRLLVKVRAPKLSKEFKPTKVYDILNDSLQTLTDEDLRPMVDAMEKMDSIQENLEQLNRAQADVKIIRNEYIRYNQFMLGKKAKAYLEAKAAAEKAKGTVEREEQRKGELLEERDDNAREKEELDSRYRLNQAELDTLCDTDLEQMEAKLDSAKRQQEEAEELKKRASGRIEECRGQIHISDIEIRRLEGERELHLDERGKLTERLEELQEELNWEGHGRIAEYSENVLVQKSRGVSGELRQLGEQIRKAKAAVDRYGEQQALRDKAAEETKKRKHSKDTRELELDQSKNFVDRQCEAGIEALYHWSRENTELVLTQEELKEIEEILLNYEAVTDKLAYDDALRRIWRIHSDMLEDAFADTRRARGIQQEELQQLQEELARVQAQEELEPKRKETVTISRDCMQLAGINAVPFYRAVEFAENLSEQSAARLESQLEDMGILDALVVSKKDYDRMKRDFPEFADCAILPLSHGSSGFSKLTAAPGLPEDLSEIVENFLSNLYESREEMTDFIWVSADGNYRQGILTGKACLKQQAEYIGVFARQRKKERKLAALMEEIAEKEAVIEGMTKQLDLLDQRKLTLEEEFEQKPKVDALNEALRKVSEAEQAFQRAEMEWNISKERLDAVESELKQRRQKMLVQCRSFPYGQTSAEYERALQAHGEYSDCWGNLWNELAAIERVGQALAVERDKIENAETRIDDYELDRKRGIQSYNEAVKIIAQMQEQLNRPDIQAKAERYNDLRKEQKRIQSKLGDINVRLGIIENELERIAEREGALKEECLEKVSIELALRQYFEEELNLKLTMERQGKSLEQCAKEAVGHMRSGDERLDAGTVTTALHNVFFKYSGNLIPYSAAMEDCFEDAEEGIEALRKRQRFSFTWNGKKLRLEAFFAELKEAIERTELLIQEKDRELFEDTLSKTISQQLTDRIAESRQWVRDMSELMRGLDTSMGLSFSLDWKPKTAENEQEMDTRELESILLMDKDLISHSDIEKVARHFRSKISTEKQKAQEEGNIINYLDLVRDSLDYRRWFEFQMSFYRNNEGKKNLTNSAFNKFSGGEKAMAMYVPLFAAVNAQYQKAGNKDHPRIIALDEAFAGVDDKNISSMFQLVEVLDFDYIMNSQALWGCYETVPALKIVELLRPLNSRVITLVNYTWNGHERVLDEQ